MKPWIEAMRLHTLPVSLAGVLTGVACGFHSGGTDYAQALLCLFFALFAQIASNFANEYFDFKDGLDSKGREGFRRGVTEGDITPRAMLLATIFALGLACLCGLLMMLLSAQWWLLLPGIVIAVFALAYSAGPWPLSRHGLGDVAVIIFFGIVPVMFTAYLVQAGSWHDWELTLPTSIAIGLMAANVLIVNNYRDYNDDKAVNKHTTVVLFGRKVMSTVYLLNGVAAMGLLWPVWQIAGSWPVVIIPLIYLSLHISLWHRICSQSGAALNPLLGKTALNLLLCTILISALLFFS